jgi:hypothetical protein
VPQDLDYQLEQICIEVKMSIWLNIASTGFGVEYTDLGGTFRRYRWNAHSFWPSFNLQNYNDVSYEWDTLALYNPTTTFDLTNFQVGHEVVLYLIEIRWDSGYSGAITIEFEDNVGTTLYTATFNYDFAEPLPGYIRGMYSWAAIGVRPQPWPELYYNGTFYAKTSGIVTNTTAFTVNNLDTSVLTRYPGKEGTMWVEGDYLWYISKIGCKHYVLPQPGGEQSTASPGSVWISNTDYRIHWCDQNGIHRKSKRGDKYWTEGWNSGTKFIGTDKIGYTFMRSSPGWTEFHYVAYDGYLVRHGPGYVHSSGDNVTGDGDCQ